MVIADTLDEIASNHDRMVGFYGSPPRDLLLNAVKTYDAPLVDLDIDFGAPSSRLVSKAYCHIIRNCVDNAVALRKNLVSVVAATGREKCDAGRFAAWLIQDALGVEVLFTENHALPPPRPPALSEAEGPLKSRVIRIMQGIVEPPTQAETEAAQRRRSEPTHGFWGTPPHPIGLLDLFPPTTHVFGWTRCVEQDRSSDLSLEMSVPSGLPIVFFNQGFCQKAALAKHLAEKHNGLHVDVHDMMNAAVQAKIEAFVRLSSPGGGF